MVMVMGKWRVERKFGGRMKRMEGLMRLFGDRMESKGLGRRRNKKRNKRGSRRKEGERNRERSNRREGSSSRRGRSRSLGNKGMSLSNSRKEGSNVRSTKTS